MLYSAEGYYACMFNQDTQYRARFWRIALAGSQRAFDIAVQALQNEALYVRSISLPLAMRALPFPAFHDLDLAIIHLILSIQLIRLGVREESFLLSSFLVEYINGILLK